MTQQTSPNESLVMSYLGMRRAVGIIGISLPFVLALGKILLEGPGILNTISSYYYSVMRDVFVGGLFAIAMFLMSYRGYERQDDIAGNLGCAFAIGVALFPVAPEESASASQWIIGVFHHLFAAGYFLTLAFFSLVLFRKSDPTKTPTHRKLQRNVVYTVCGYTILACIALIVVATFMPGDANMKKLGVVFWLESIAIVAFGVSWFTKGEAILGDGS
jgi:hypothetical protein